MTSISLVVNGASAVARASGKITSGMVGLPVYIQYDESWNDLSKTAHFRVGKLVRKQDPVGTATTVPWELLRNHGFPLQIGVEGKNKTGDIVIPTVWATVDTICEGAHGDIPAAPNPASGDAPTGDGAAIDDGAVSFGTTWSSKNIVDRLCPTFTESGAVVTCQPVAGYPLEVVSHIRPVQAGSGDPSPDNIRPITGHAQIKLTRCGKNLFNIDGALNSALTKDGGNYKMGYIDNRQSAYVNMPVPAGATIMFSADIVETTTTSGKPLSLQLYYEDGYASDNITVWGTNTYAKTLSTEHGNLKMVRLYMQTEDNGKYTIFKNAQVEFGETRTAYEPYRGMDTFTLDLGQTIYGGSLNWQTGVLTVDREVRTFKGTEKWTYSTPKDGYCRIQYSGGGVFSKDTRVCSHYIMYTGYSESHTFPYLRCNDGGSNWVYEGKQDGGYFASADDFKAYLAEQYAAGTPVQVICKMAASVTVQLTQQEILALSGVNTLYSDTGDTTVTGRADPQTVIEDLYDKINQLLANAVNNA